MSAKKCAPNCVKAQQRRREALQEYENIQRSRIGAWRPPTISSFDSELSDATEYQSLPRRDSTPVHETVPSREHIQHIETPPSTVRRRLNKTFTCVGNRGDPHEPTHRSRKDRTPRKQLSEDLYEQVEFSGNQESDSKLRTVTQSTNRRQKDDDTRGQQRCPNDDCSPPKFSALLQSNRSGNREDSDEDSDIQNDSSETESLVCPELCERDLLQIPIPKKTCKSTCPKQVWLARQREKHQKQVDRYFLNKGMNYFEDLCHCSLKCLITQICMDPFVKKTVASAAFFFVGIKLCFELDSWYIPF